MIVLDTLLIFGFMFFFFKQKTAYEMRISDWSSDVCSSDLLKQTVLLENLQRIGHVAPERVLPPLRDGAWGYRRKGRFSVRYVEKKGKTLVGFREVDPRFVADIGDRKSTRLNSSH